MKKLHGIFIAGFIVLGTFSAQTVLAGEEQKVTEEKVKEWEEQEIDPNHNEAIEQLRGYIDENFSDDEFASLHINRQKQELGIIILSFTSMPSESQMNDMEELVEEPAQIDFREVAFTEEELKNKQKEIDQEVFEDKRWEDQFTVYSTSADIINNRVEIGIDSRTEENVQKLEKTYGAEWIDVIEIEAPHTKVEETEEKEETQKKGETVLNRIFSLVRNWMK